MPNWKKPSKPRPAHCGIQPEAKRDLLEISRQGTRLFGPKQALAYASQLGELISRIAGFPLIDPQRTEFDPPLRVCPHKAHLTLYHLADETVTILRVRHGREDWLEV